VRGRAFEHPKTSAPAKRTRAPVKAGPMSPQDLCVTPVLAPTTRHPREGEDLCIGKRGGYQCGCDVNPRLREDDGGWK
jgi:hypothetical protein